MFAHEIYLFDWHIIHNKHRLFKTLINKKTKNLNFEKQNIETWKFKKIYVFFAVKIIFVNWKTIKISFWNDV